MVEDLFFNIKKQIRLHFGKCEVRVHGSFATELDMPWSDLDIFITGIKTKEVKDVVLILKRLAGGIESLVDVVKEVKIKNENKNQVIKIVCTERYNSKRVNIVLESDLDKNS